MVPTVRQPLAELPCQVCAVRLGDKPLSLIHIQHRVVSEAMESWGEEVAHWQAHCADCNPHLENGYYCGGCYAFGVDHEFDWNDHLTGKDWMAQTNWRDVYRRARDLYGRTVA